MSRTIRALIVDDSVFVCDLLRGYLNHEADIEVVGVANDGYGALKLVRRLRPDVITLDLDLPGLSGLEVLTELMGDCPTPTVVISGVSGNAATQTLQALDRGAVDFVLKYSTGQQIDPELLRYEIVSKVRASAGIRVVRTVSTQTAPEMLLSPVQPSPQDSLPRELDAVVVVGASTGGPQALRQLLSELRPGISFGLIVVQHLPPSFTSVLAAQLDRRVALRVREAGDLDSIEPGLALVAPGDRHLLITSECRVNVLRGPAVGGHCPSIDVTMESAAQALGDRCIGVLLSGMGSDGSEGMSAIHARGGKTFVQDESSCVVYGMPQQAVGRGVVDVVSSPLGIGRQINRLQVGRTPLVS